MIAYFVVEGEPVGKSRPKFRKVGEFTQTYTPKKTRDYETMVRAEYARQCGKVRFEERVPLYVLIDCYTEIAKSVSRKKAQRMEAKIIRPVKKADWDNIGKSICDSLNEVAYKDDAYIVDGRVRKYYSNRPRAEVIISDQEITPAMVEYVRTRLDKERENQ